MKVVTRAEELPIEARDERGPIYIVRQGSRSVPIDGREAMEEYRRLKRESVSRGPMDVQATAGTSDLAVPAANGDIDEDIAPIRPPPTVADIAREILNYSESIHSKSNLQKKEVLPFAVGVTFYERHNNRIGLEFVYNMLSLKMSEVGPTHRVSQLVKIFEHLLGTTKTEEKKTIQL